MTKQNQTSEEQQRGLMDLDFDTPVGLFTTEGMEVYLVASDGYQKTAILLASDTAPIFSFTALDDDFPLDDGFSLGPARLRLTSRREPNAELDQVGLIRIVRNEVQLSCQGRDGTLIWLSIATTIIPDDALGQQFDGWTLDDPDGDALFMRSQSDELVPVPLNHYRGKFSCFVDVQVDLAE